MFSLYRYADFIYFIALDFTSGQRLFSIITLKKKHLKTSCYLRKSDNMGLNLYTKLMTNDRKISLRPTTVEDLEYLFKFQLDKEAIFLAAFTPKDPSDKNAYIEKYTKLLSEPTVHNQTIIVDDSIVGSIAKFLMGDDAEITYWIDSNFWNKGITTAALREFLTIENTRPLFGRVAFDNYGSQKVLENCGFVRIGKDKGFANARQAEIEELIYKLI